MVLDPEAWRGSGKYFEHGSHSIFYRDEGAGAALVCIHGFPTSSWDWHRLWPDLSKRFRVIALDMLGFGFSDKPRPHDYRIAEQADMHERLLQSLGVESAHFLAHDYGDTVAQELLARYEERQRGGAAGLQIRSLCLLNGGLFPESHRPRLIQLLLLGPLGPLLARTLSEKRFRKSFCAIFGPKTQPGEEELAAFWMMMRHNQGLRAIPNLLRYLPERKQHRARWVGALQTTSVPLRFINGPEDPISGAHMVQRYQELVPHPDVISLEGIGHYPQMEDPDGVLAAFLAFIERVNSERAK